MSFWVSPGSRASLGVNGMGGYCIGKNISLFIGQCAHCLHSLMHRMMHKWICIWFLKLLHIIKTSCGLRTVNESTSAAWTQVPTCWSLWYTYITPQFTLRSIEFTVTQLLHIGIRRALKAMEPYNQLQWIPNISHHGHLKLRYIGTSRNRSEVQLIE